LALIGFLVPSVLSFAHQVTLKHGDRLSGTFVKSDGKTLVPDTDAAGEVKFDAIQDIKPAPNFMSRSKAEGRW
jgi:hypothetical protein